MKPRAFRPGLTEQHARNIADAAARLLDALNDDENHMGQSVLDHVCDELCSCPCTGCPSDKVMRACYHLDQLLAAPNGLEDYEAHWMHDDEPAQPVS